MIENAFWTCRSYSWTVGLGLQKAKSTETTRFDVFERKFRYTCTSSYTLRKVECKTPFFKKQGCVPRLSILCYNDTIYLRYFRVEHTHIYPVAFRDCDIKNHFSELLPHLDRLLNYFPIIESFILLSFDHETFSLIHKNQKYDNDNFIWQATLLGSTICYVSFCFKLRR